MPGLLHLDERIRQRTGPDYDVITLLNPGQELRELSDGRFVIGVDKPDDFAPGQRHPAPQSVALAVTPAFRGQPKARPLARKLPDDLRRLVVAIGGNDDLIRVVLAI